MTPEMYAVIGIAAFIGVCIYLYMHNQSVHAKLDAFGEKLGLIHNAALAPVSVTTVGASTAGPAAAPVTVTVSGEPAHVTSVLNTISSGYLGVPAGTATPIPPAPAPIPAFAPGLPTPSVSWGAFDGSHPICDFAPGSSLKVSLSGEPKDKGCILSMTRVAGPDANFTVSNGILSGTSNDWTVQLAPGSCTTEISANVATRYGLAIRPA